MSRQSLNTDTVDRSALPRTFGNYVLFDRIGAGGMAEIFLARSKTQSGVGRLAVVKLVLPHLASDQRFSELLVQEAKLAAQLSHGNIVQTFDLGRHDGRLFIAMEYVEGFDLNELLKRCSKAKVPLPTEYALCVVAEVLRALEYAHRKKDTDGQPLGIVHRDVSPSNILVSFEGEIKLCDFGIARALKGNDAPTDTIEGKASYMAPETARGDGIDGRADIFSIAVIMWELLAGRRLYRPAPGVDMLALARAAQIPELPERELPEFARLRAIVKKGTARSPSDRYTTALEMVRELDDYLISTRLIASPLDLGSFVVDYFGQEILTLRAERERLAIEFDEPPAPLPQPTPEEMTQEHYGPPSQMWDEDDTGESDVEYNLDQNPDPSSRQIFLPKAAVGAPPVPIPRAQPVQAGQQDPRREDERSPFESATMTAPIPLLASQIAPQPVLLTHPVNNQSQYPMPTHMPTLPPLPSLPSSAPMAPFGHTPNEPRSVGAKVFALLFGAVIVFAIGLLVMLRNR